MLKVVVLFAAIIYLGGHFIPVQTHAPDPEQLVTKTEKVTKQYRILRGNYDDYKQTSEQFLCNITCNNTENKLYLW